GGRRGGLGGRVERGRRAGTTKKNHERKMAPPDGTTARRYMNELHDTIKTLEDPNVSKYVGGAWSAKGNNVAELVYNMTSQGLKFAAVTEGDDSYYRALYQSLRAYDMGLSQLASRQ